jgi:excisionase family DNA binding protein
MARGLLRRVEQGVSSGLNMKGRTRKKSPKKRWIDPGQLGLFDAIETRAGAGSDSAKAPKAMRSRAALVERPAVLTPREAAHYLNVSASTLKNWRAKNFGPAWRKRGARLIAYFPADLDAFLRENANPRTQR